MRKLILAITLIISTFAFAQDETGWKYIGDTNDGSEIYVKIESIDTYLKEAWVKMTNPVISKKNKVGKIIKSGGGYSIGYWAVKCEDKTFSLSSRMKYNSKGAVLSQGEEYLDPRDERIIPDTVGEHIFKYICNYKSE